MNKLLLIFGISILSVFSVLSQTMKKTSLEIPEMRDLGSGKMNGNASSITLIDMDDDNYYYHLMERDRKSHGTFDLHILVSIRKDLTTMEQTSFFSGNYESFLEIVSNENEIIIFTKQNKSGEVSFLKKTFSKSDLKLVNESTVVTFEHGKFITTKYQTATSPDKSKIAIIGLISAIEAQRSTFEDAYGKIGSYCIAVIDKEGELVWERMENLSIGNESFKVDDFVLTNDAQLYVLFNSYPKNREKAADSKSYLDLISFDEKEKKELHIPFEDHLNNVKLHVLKNGNLFIAGVSSSYSQQTYFNKILSIDDGEFIAEDAEKISFKRNSYVQSITGLARTLGLSAEVKAIYELENGKISVLCEQVSNVSLLNGSYILYQFTVRGDIVSFLVEEDGIIKFKNGIEKFQKQMNAYGGRRQTLQVSIFPFISRGKMGYLFNDAVENHIKPIPKEKFHFKKPHGKDSGIYLVLEENDGSSQTIALTGTTPANKFLCQILAVEDDKLIVLTRDKKSAYIETISLR